MQENLGDYSEGGFGEGDYGENPESFHSGHSRTEEDDTEPEDVTEVGDEDYEGDDKQADVLKSKANYSLLQCVYFELL